MKVAIVAHGQILDINYLKKNLLFFDKIVCADGGYDYVIQAGFSPDILIGDLDSINADMLKSINKNIKIIKYPTEKDYTDTQLSINYAIENGADEIVIFGAIGNRLDHTIANILLLIELLNKGVKASIKNENNEVYIINKSIELKGQKDDLVSLIPIGAQVTGIYTQGLKYALCGSNIPLGNPLGISNVFLNQKVSIEIESGYLMVIKSKD